MALHKIFATRTSTLEIDKSHQDYLILANGGVEVKSGVAIHEKDNTSDNIVTINGSVSSGGKNQPAILSEGRESLWVIGAKGEVSGGLGIMVEGRGTAVFNAGEIRASGQSALWFEEGRHLTFNDGIIAAQNGIGIGLQSGELGLLNTGRVTGEVAIYSANAELNIYNDPTGKITGEQAAIWSISDRGSLITNEGAITSPAWALLLGSGRDRVLNAGLMTGQVDLGGGKDDFLQDGGTFTGFLFMGGGDDYFQYRSGIFNSPTNAKTWIRGGQGDDVYDTGMLSVLCLEAKNAGYDTQIAERSTGLRAFIEELVLTGNSALTGQGNASANRITGNDGANFLFGLGGRDRIDGGEGDDTLHGGDGRDIFDFNRLHGNDTIADWANGADRLDVSALAGVSGFADIVAAMAQAGADVTLTLADGTITIQNSLVADFDAADFIF